MRRNAIMPLTWDDETAKDTQGCRETALSALETHSWAGVFPFTGAHWLADHAANHPRLPGTLPVLAGLTEFTPL
jgi:hypothetical protein